MESWEGLRLATHDIAPSSNVWNKSVDTLKYTEFITKAVYGC